jgi:hypothetical protein
VSRDYGKVLSRFWTQGTGRQLRGDPDAQLVALYLFSCHSSNMIGLYYLPVPVICHETGLPLEGALKALRRLEGVGLAYYDSDAEEVWVPEMAKIQVGEALAKNDKQCKGVAREWGKFQKSRFYMEFYTRYWKAYHLPQPAFSNETQWPLEAPSIPLRSQEQEQEQKQDQKSPPIPPGGAGGSAPPEVVHDPVEDPPSFELSPAGLGSAWVWYLRRTRQRSKADDPADAAAVFGELLRLGVAAMAILADITDPKRDRSEHLWQAKNRLLARFGPQPQSPPRGPPAAGPHGGNGRGRLTKEEVAKRSLEPRS